MSKLLEKDPNEWTELEVMSEYEKYLSLADEIDGTVKVFREWFLDKLTSEGLKGKSVGDWDITRKSMIKPQLTLDEARELEAVKVEEKVDNTKIKRLIEAGAKIKHEVVNYVAISRKKEEEKSE